jgi:hypothetical protein
MHARLVDARGICLSEAKLKHGARWDRTKYAKDVLLLMSVELFPFLAEPKIPNSKRLELATSEETKGLFFGCSPTTDAMDYFMSASTVQFVSTSVIYRFEQIGVTTSGVAMVTDTEVESPSSPIRHDERGFA